MFAQIKKILPASFKEKVKHKLGVPNMFYSLVRLKTLGFNPKTIVDVGAFEGEWSKRTSRIFPDAKFLMLDALQSKELFLQKVNTENKNIDFSITLLGANDNEEIYFSELETASSALAEKAATHNRVKKTLTTLNTVLSARRIAKVDLLKLDVQGYELEVLKGYSKYIEQTDVILSEVSLLDIHQGAPLIKDVINYLYQYGFVVYDICSVETRRPLDKALWQTDLLFVKEDSVFRKDKRYSA